MTAMSPSIAFSPTLPLLTSSPRKARVIFKAGKNHDRYFGAEEILAQVNSAIDIFEGLSQGNFKALFLFDNAPSHQKQAPDAISARKMPKGVPLFFFFPFYFPLQLMQGQRTAGVTPLRLISVSRVFVSSLLTICVPPARLQPLSNISRT